MSVPIYLQLGTLDYVQLISRWIAELSFLRELAIKFTISLSWDIIELANNRYSRKNISRQFDIRFALCPKIKPGQMTIKPSNNGLPNGK